MAGPWEKYAEHPSGKYRKDLKHPRALDYERLKYSPTVGMGTTERVVAGYGSAAPRVGRTISNLIGGMSDEDYQESLRLDEPLRATTGGQIGEFLGQTALAVPLSRLPGATTIPGGAGYGSAFGLVQPARNRQERVSNVALSGLGGAAVPATARSAVPLRNLQTQIPRLPRDPLLDEMITAGYRVTPVEAQAGAPLRAAQGLAGSAKLEKLNALHNQGNTNNLIKQEFNLPSDDRLSVDKLEQIRRGAGQAYEAVKSSVKSIKPDAQFRSDLSDLRGDLSAASNTYPTLLRNDQVENLIRSLDKPASPRAMVELTKKLRHDATANLKAFDDPAKHELGMAQHKAARALENMIDRALTSVGKTGLVTEWRNARQLIAKTYDIEAALNETTGDVSSRQLAKMYERGAPFTGNLEKVAKFGRAYKKSAQDVAGMSDAPQFSLADVGMGALGSLGTGDVTGMAAIGARPGMRYLMSSPLTQSFFKRPRELPLSDLRNIDTVTRAALPVTLGGLAVRRKEDQE